MRPRANPDFAKAKTLLERAHQAGHENANSILMLYYQGEFGGEPDPTKLEKLLLTSAERDSGIAQLNYASNFIYSDVASQSGKALQFLTRASTNPTVAENALPMLIEVLYGVDSDKHRNLPLARQKAQDCVRRWAQNLFCHYILGQDFGNGWAGSVDKTKSDFHFLKAAEAGDARAQWQIGMYHLNGERVPKNEKTAYYWVKKSADQDYVDGLISYAVMKAVGQGTAVNTAAAFQAYEKAASFGSAHALRAVGAMYCSGEAPKTDRDLCAAALILAYEMEDDLSANLLTRFFNVQDQAGFDALKTKTAGARANLSKQYDIPL
jgi:TPR repeat protein